MKRIITKSAEETQAFAKKLAQKMVSPTVIALYGDLGAGKTTFTQGFAKGLGITQKIISPTFIIMRKYEFNSNLEKNINSFYHVDLYRLESEKEIECTGLLEVLNENKNIEVIEWPEKMGSLLPKKRIDISFNYINHSEREISVEIFQ